MSAPDKYFRSMNGAEHMSFDSLEDALRGAATAPPMRTVGREFNLTYHEVTPFGTTTASRPHIPGYSGYVPARNIDTDRIPSSIGRNPWPGSNPVQMGMDKMRAFRSVLGYTGHVPSLNSPLRGGKGVNSQTSLNIVTALRSVLDSGVDIGVVARCLDRTKSGWLDAEKILDGMRKLGFRMVTMEDVDIILKEFGDEVDQGQLPTATLLGAVTDKDWTFTSDASFEGSPQSPPPEKSAFDASSYSSLPFRSIGDGVRPGAASAPPYVSPYEPKVFQDYRFPLRSDYWQIKDRHLFSRGRIPGYTGYIPLVRPQNRTLGRDVVGKSFSRQSRIVKTHMEQPGGFPSLLPAETQGMRRTAADSSSPSKTGGRAAQPIRTTICGMISEPGPAMTPTIKTRASALRLKASHDKRTPTLGSALITNLT